MDQARKLWRGQGRQGLYGEERHLALGRDAGSRQAIRASGGLRKVCSLGL